MKQSENEIALMAILTCLIIVLRPFAKVADAQKHTDCGGMLTQTDWEAAAECVAAYDEDVARQGVKGGH